MATIIFNEKPFSDADLVNPGRAAEQWHDRTDINIPTEGINTTPFDVYYRATWNRFEGDTENSWNWTWLDARLNEAILKKQTLHLGMMSCYTEVNADTGGVQVDGAWSAVPKYLIAKMKAETPKCWVLDGSWIPNWNSPSYLTSLLRLNQAINTHIQGGTHPSGVKYKHVVGIIDIRGFGNWGEWHSAYKDGFTVSQYPAGTFPTIASYKKIIDAYRDGFPDNPLVAMISGFDAFWLNNTMNPPEIADYLLRQKNAWGEFGWRRDNWGATDGYIDDYLINNNRTFNNIQLKTLIMEKWKKAPITGEPPGWNPGDYFDLQNQVRKYNATFFGNGNYGVTPTTTIKQRVRAASKDCGYRFKVLSATTNVSGSQLQINMNWQNVGRGNCWQDWNVVFELIGTNLKGVSKHKLKFFQPGPAISVSDNFDLTGIAAGTYSLRFYVADPNGYRVNMALAVLGNDTSNRFSLGSVTLGTTPPVNEGPKANAGGDLVLTLPVNSATLNGSGSDTDGTIVSYKWEVVAGSGTITNPSSAITQITNLTTGTNKLRLTVTDNGGAQGTDEMIITVNSAPVPEPKPIKKIDAIIDYYVVTYNDDTSQVIDA